MRTNWLFTMLGLLLLYGEGYLCQMRLAWPPIDPYADGLAGIGIVSVFLIQVAVALVAGVLFLALGIRMAFNPLARNRHTYLNLLLLIAVPLLFLIF